MAVKYGSEILLPSPGGDSRFSPDWGILVRIMQPFSPRVTPAKYYYTELIFKDYGGWGET